MLESVGMRLLGVYWFAIGAFALLAPGCSGQDEHETHTHASEGAEAEARTSGVVGGVIGWLAGIGALAIPGVGLLAAAGPIMAALAEAAAGAAVRARRATRA